MMEISISSQCMLNRCATLPCEVEIENYHQTFTPISSVLILYVKLDEI